MPDEMTRFPDHRSGDRYGVFHVSELGDQRWSAAIARFAEGGTIAFDAIGFQLAPPDRLIVSPPWSDERLPTMAEAEAAFSRGDACLTFLAESDASFGQLVSGRRVEMELLAPDGMGLISVANRRDGQTRLG